MPTASPPPEAVRSDRPEIRCVVFDWGGVILGHCRSWEEACQRINMPVRASVQSPEILAARRELNQQYTLGKVSCERFFSALTDLCGGAYTLDEVCAIHRAWLTEEYPGVGELIDRLHWGGRVETGLLSNTCAAHWARHLPRHARPADFPTIARLRHKHASHLMGLAKPGHEIFKAFEKASGVRGRHVLFFDDLPDNIAAARAAGWHAERIDHTRSTAPQLDAILHVYGVL
jgi:glucose-1-phosphatase